MLRVLVLYDSKTGNTEKMASAIAEGLKDSGNEVDIKRMGEPFAPSIISGYDGLALGSPAIYADATRELRELLTMLREHVSPQRTGRARAGIFGSYGYDGAWSLENKLKGYATALGYDLFPDACMKVDTEIRTRTEETLAECREWGRRLSGFLSK